MQWDEHVRLPVRPMVGCPGTAPAGPGVATALAGDHRDNMDYRIITTGSRVYLPVQVPGALFAVGDVHAAMGDGELSRFGVEVQADVVITRDLVKGRRLRRPIVETPGVIALRLEMPRLPGLTVA